MKINGEGTIERRGDKTFRIRFNLGIDPVTKEYRYSPWRTVHGTKADAQAARSEYRQEIEDGIRLDADKMTFMEFAELFCSQRKALGSYAPATLQHECYQVKHLNRYLGETPLREIDALTVKNLLAALGKEGKQSGAIRRAYKTLKQIMQEALLSDIITRNPCDKVKTPKADKTEVSFLDTEGITRLLAALEKQEQDKACRNRGENVRGIFQASHVMATKLALGTGMRRGEVLGLTWGCVDLQNQSLRVVQQMTSDGIRPPKTERGKRKLALDEETIASLKAWKARQAEYLLSLGINQKAKTPVITNELGDFHEPHGFSRWWREFCKTYDFEGLKFHDLRHTQATMLIARGVDIKTVQGRLGHERASTTLDLYAGILPEKDREAANVVGSLLAAPTPELGVVVNL
jgi:integrase